jgi:uncharacterized protein YbjT (DUF2867 family)
MNKLKVILTGATGMIGEGVLYECINHPEIEKITVITRKPTGYKHPMLTEIIHNDFSDVSALSEQLKGYNACYFCLGVTSIGKNEADYTRLTYALTLNFAETLAKLNRDMTFCYVSGAGTDSTEKGRTMWARVKGKTENDLMKLPFKQVYNFRPGGIEPFLPLRSSQTYYKTYKYLKWLFAVMKVVTPGLIVGLKELATAMINASLVGYSKNIVEISDIKQLAKANH